MRPPLEEIRRMLERAIAKCDRDLAAWVGETNPQVVAMRYETRGAREAFQDTLDALNGNPVMLRISGTNFSSPLDNN